MVVDYYAADGELAAVHSGYPDARKEALILEIRRRYRAERGENGEVLAALRSGEPLLYPDMTRIASVRLSQLTVWTVAAALAGNSRGCKRQDLDALGILALGA